MRAPVLAFECPVSWDSLVGEGDTRYCTLCEKDVINLSACSRSEVEDILSGPSVCVRFLRSSAGLLLFGAMASPGLVQAEGYGAEGWGTKPEGDIPAIHENTGAVMGAFDKSIIQDAMSAASIQVRYAWTKSDSQKRGEEGKVVVKLTLTSKGTVASAEIKSSEFDDDDFHEALIEVLEDIEFPGATSAIVTYPFRFTPAE
jgi:TonB family protein